MLETLTPRQEAFCLAFVMGGSGAAAARAAGYSRDGARTQAWRLMRNRAVRTRLRQLRHDTQAAEDAFAARLMARAEALFAKAEADANHGLALRAVQMQFRIAGRYGAPASAMLDDDGALPDAELAALTADTLRIELDAPLPVGADVRAAAVAYPAMRGPEGDARGTLRGATQDAGNPSGEPGSRAAGPAIPLSYCLLSPSGRGAMRRAAPATSAPGAPRVRVRALIPPRPRHNAGSTRRPASDGDDTRARMSTGVNMADGGAPDAPDLSGAADDPAAGGPDPDILATEHLSALPHPDRPIAAGPERG